MPYLEGMFFPAHSIDAARDEFNELRKARAGWVRAGMPGRERRLYCPTCAPEQDDAVPVTVDPGTACEECGESAP